MEQTGLHPSSEEITRVQKELDGNSKVLILAISVDAAKNAKTTQEFEERGFVVTTFETGEAAVEMFQTLEETTAKPPKIIMLIPGKPSPLRPGSPSLYGTSVALADRVMEISKEKGWNPPYFMGTSGIGEQNNALKDAHPEQYIGAYKARLPLQHFVRPQDRDRIFKAIETKLSTAPTQ